MFYEVEIPEPRGASGEPTGYIICKLGRQLRLGCFGSAQPTQGALSKGESKRKQRPYSMAKPSGK